MAEPLPRPVAKVFDGLGGSRLVQSAQVVITADDANDFDINNVGCGVIGLRGQAVTNAFSQAPVGDDFV